jgi:hypothetical protein
MRYPLTLLFSNELLPPLHMYVFSAVIGVACGFGYLRPAPRQRKLAEALDDQETNVVTLEKEILQAQQAHAYEPLCVCV